MRIDSTDASNVYNSKSQETMTSTKELTKPTKEIANKENILNEVNIDNMVISNMEPMDKSELPVSEKLVIDAVEKANKALSIGNRKIEFSIHAKTNEIMVKVIDIDSGDIIREIPREKTLDMLAKLWEMAGLSVDERR